MATLFVLCLAAQAAAHEIQASVADISIAGGTVRLAISTNLEARLAGIGTEHDDTDDAPQSERYDALRRLEPDALKGELDAFYLQRTLIVRAGDERVAFALVNSEIPPVGDLALARTSQLTFEGALPSGASAVTVQAPDWGDFILRGTGENEAYSEFLQGQTSQPIAVMGKTERGFGEVFVQYLGVGFEHIVPLGLDHILFVVGLFLLAPRIRPLLWQVTAFTLAHTVTLALGALDVVRVPGSVVEPLIALSIVFVAVENILARGLSPWRPMLVFAFGLLHGLGFASVFEAYGIPEGQFTASLLAFNIGVEGGQLLVLAVCFALVGLPFRDRPWYRAAVTVPGSLLVGAIGLYWTLVRTGMVPEFVPGL